MIIKLDFSAEEWREIYYALEGKAQRIREGAYGGDNEGDGVNPKEWAGQLDAIASKIADEVNV